MSSQYRAPRTIAPRARMPREIELLDRGFDDAPQEAVRATMRMILAL